LKKKMFLALTGILGIVAGAWGASHPQVVRSAVDSAVQPVLNASLDRGLSVADAEADAQEVDEGPAPAVASNYDLSAHQTLSHVIVLIRENYVEPDRIKPYEMFIAALDYIQKTVPEVMVDDHKAPARITVSVGNASQAFELGNLDQLWEVAMALRDIFRFLQTKIADPTQRRDVEYAAINGMLSTLDPHSILLKPESFDEVKMSTKGEFGGLGIVISLRDAALTIISPIEGTPAFKAGLKSRDKIVKIGEESTINMGLDEAVQRLRGKAGSKVTIWVGRKGWTEPRKFILARAIIKIESVTSELLADGVGYVKIKSFQGNTFDDLQSHLEALRHKNKDAEIKGLVLDLRNNPGGLLDQAILISDRFIERGPLVITVGEGNRKREVKSAHFSGDESVYPIAVLLNGGSASASEIVSGALKNHDRALVIGQQSFGKGSVQVLYDFKDRSALKLTIAQYLTPGDISIQSVGVVPDVAIVPAVIEKDGIHLFVDDDSPREKDLEKHLDQHGVSALTTSAIKILHLSPHEQEVDANGAAVGPHEVEEVVSDSFTYDFETQLAHDVLLATKSLKRQTMVKEAMALLHQRADAEDQVVASRFKELGVNWQAEPAAAAPPATAAANAGAAVQPSTPPTPALQVAMATSAHAEPVAAGALLTLTGTVHNVGDKPLYRVYGVSQSDNPLLKNLEFVFGTLQPNEVRHWDVKIKLPADMPSRADGVTLSVGDAHGMTQLHSAVAFVKIEEQKKPRFAYSYSIDDSRSGGNGDGVLQVGEPIVLRVNVKNLGPGAAEDVTVSLKNLAGKPLFLDQGRSKLGALSAGMAKNAELKFTLKQAVPGDVAKVRLTIYDGALGSAIAETLALPILPARRGKTEEHGLRVSKVGEAAVYVGASEAMPTLGTVKAGSVLRGQENFGGWWKVDALPGLPGYVQQADVVVAAGKAKKYSKGALATTPAATAPNIIVDLPSLVVTGDTLRLHGSVQDDKRLKDMFVFVNEKKVFFRNLEEVARGDHGLQTDFDVALPLKAGANSIAVIVREDDDMVARKFFGVYRNGGPVGTGNAGATAAGAHAAGAEAATPAAAKATAPVAVPRAP
jgi:carboxyl-terminal processing protease